MKRRVFTGALALGTVWAPALLRAQSLPAMTEVPSLAEQVKSGALPPVDKRIPQKPLVVSKSCRREGRQSSFWSTASLPRSRSSTR